MLPKSLRTLVEKHFVSYKVSWNKDRSPAFVFTGQLLPPRHQESATVTTGNTEEEAVTKAFQKAGLSSSAHRVPPR